jgi:membrane protease YdiL (CAAX protease family)
MFVIAALVRRVLEQKTSNAGYCQSSPGNNAPSPDEAIAKPPLPPAIPLGKVPSWFYHPLDLIGAAFVLLVFGGLVLTSLGTPTPSTTALNPGTLCANIAFQFIFAGVMTSLVFWRISVVTWLGLRWPNWHWILLIAPCTVFSMWTLFGLLQYFGYMKWMESLGAETVQDTVKLLQESKDPLVIGLMALAAVVAAPICEEIIFRGYFYPVLKRFAGAWPAAICSAMVFSAAHGNLTALLPLFIFGGLLVWIYEKTGSIWAPIAVHFCFNGATVIMQLAARYYNLPMDPPA